MRYTVSWVISSLYDNSGTILVQRPFAKIQFNAEGTPVAEQFDDVYFSKDDADTFVNAFEEAAIKMKELDGIQHFTRTPT